MARIYLIRHGRPASSWGDVDPDPGLDAVGAEQAQAVAHTLLSLPEAVRPIRVISSPLRRCRETAQPFADALGMPAKIVAEVGEIPTPLDIAAASRSAWLSTAFAGRWSQINGDLDYDAWRRDVALAVGNAPLTAVFSHFVAINAVVSVLAGHDRVIDFRPDHTSITVLEVGESGLKIFERGHEAQTGVL